MNCATEVLQSCAFPLTQPEPYSDPGIGGCAADLPSTIWITAQGTQRGELMGIDPTGREVTVHGITISRISAGKVVESWSNWDALGMLVQLGAVPEPTRA